MRRRVRGRQDEQEAEQSPSGLGTLRLSWSASLARLECPGPVRDFDSKNKVDDA